MRKQNSHVEEGLTKGQPDEKASTKSQANIFVSLDEVLNLQELA